MSKNLGTRNGVRNLGHAYKHLVELALRLVSLLGRSKLLLHLTMPTARIGYSFARWVFVGVSDPSGALITSMINALGPSVGVTQHLSNRYFGIYTGRAISIHDLENPRRPFTPDELGLGCTDLEVCKRVLCEAVFERTSRIMSQGWSEVDEMVEHLKNSLDVVGNEEIRHRIVHEVLHAHIAQGTSASTHIEGISWRIRFDYMYILEKLYRNIGRDLATEVEKHGYKKHEEFRVLSGFSGLDADRVNDILKKLESRLDKLSKDDSLRIAMNDGVRHQLWLRIFAGGVVVPVQETTTWYLLGYDLLGTLGEYETLGLFDPEFHGSIALELIDALEERKPEKSRVMEAARATLDFPPTIYEDLMRRIEGLSDKKKITEQLKSIVRDRFVNALDGVHIDRAPPRHKTLLGVMLYAAPVEKIPDLVHTFVEIFNSEPEVKEKLLRVVGRGSRGSVGTYTSFFINISVGDRTETVAYDPLSGLTCGSEGGGEGIIGTYIRRTGLRFGTFEDLVGDLPLALRGFLSILHLPELREDEEKWVKLVARWMGVSEERKDRLHDVARRVRKVDLNELTGEPSYQTVREILELFLYSVLRLGEDVKNLGGLHGLWFL